MTVTNQWWKKDKRAGQHDRLGVWLGVWEPRDCRRAGGLGQLTRGSLSQPEFSEETKP